MPSPITIQFDHCQSDNLSIMSLVDSSNLPAPGVALRWQPRYSIGLPPQAAVYWRPAAKLGTTSVTLDGSPASRLVVRNVVTGSQSVPVPLSPQGASLPSGSVQIRFARPVISVELMAPGSTLILNGGVAYHSPSAAAMLAPSAAAGGVGRFSADLIDTIVLDVAQAGPLESLQVIMLDQTNSNNWTQFLQLDFPGGQWPGKATWPADQTAMLLSLFDPTVKDAAGRILPMGERAFQDSQPEGNLSLPKLALLLFSSFAPNIARDLGLLTNPTQPDAALHPFDYAIVGQYPSRQPLTSAIKLDFLLLLQSIGTQLGTSRPFQFALLTSPLPMQLVPPATRIVGGLLLKDAPVWLLFSKPVQAVEFFPDPNFPVEATAFANVNGGPGQRIVDWMLARDRKSVVLCGDRIDAVSFVAPNGATITAITFAVDDPALPVGPAAAVGAVAAVSFMSRIHPLPQAPGPVVATVLADPVAPPPPSGGLSQRDNKSVKVGVAFNGSPPPASVTYDGVAYTLTRGPLSRLQTDTLVPVTAPLVLTERAQIPTVPSTGSVWSQGSSITPDPSAAAIDYLDTAATATGRLGSTVYAVRSLDLFGRLSAPAYSPPVALVSRAPLPAPINVKASLQSSSNQNDTYQITWDWPADPALGTNADITGFHVYIAPPQPARGWKEGAVTTVTEAVAGEAPSPNQLPFFHVDVHLDPSLIDQKMLAGRNTRVGADHYVICDASPDASGVDIDFRIYVNLSTPNARPTVGDTFRIYDAASTPGALAGASLYDTSSHPSLPALNQARSLAVPIYLPGSGAAAGAVLWPAGDQNGVSSMIVGVSAYDSAGESAICGPVPISHVDTSSIAPPLPSTESEDDVYTEPPNSFGRCRYHYQALVTPDGLYHVYRTLDSILVSTRESATMVVAPSVPYPTPITAADFQSVIALPQQDPRNLTNLQLHVLANLSGVESAFERLTTDPIGVASSGSAQPVTLDYLDQTLPGGGTNRYLYRLRAVSKSGELGDWGWVSPPVWLRPDSPTRPTVQNVTVAGPLVVLSWTANPEPQVTSYRIHYTLDESAAADERAMSLAGEVSAADALDDSGGPNLRATLQVPLGSRIWFRLAAVAAYPAPIGTLVSAPSDAFSILPQTHSAPLPPASPVAQRSTTQITVTFQPDSNSTSRYQLLRGAPGARPQPVGPWISTTATPGAVIILEPPQAAVTPAQTPPLTLTDQAPLDASIPVEYHIACTNESRRVAIYGPIAL